MERPSVKIRVLTEKPEVVFQSAIEYSFGKQCHEAKQIWKPVMKGNNLAKSFY